jgi:hypothetical protein
VVCIACVTRLYLDSINAPGALPEYVAALTNADVPMVLRSTLRCGVAVSYVEWARMWAPDAATYRPPDECPVPDGAVVRALLPSDVDTVLKQWCVARRRRSCAAACSAALLRVAAEPRHAASSARRCRRRAAVSLLHVSL